MSEFVLQAIREAKEVKAVGGSAVDFDSRVKAVLGSRDMRHRISGFKRLGMLKQARAIFQTI